MRRVILLLTLVLTLSTARAQGIDFFEGTWPEAQLQAEAQDKLIFVDAYATWCGPCKRMAATVFPDEEVGAYFNRNFVSLKIDMEAPENAEFRSAYPVAAFPTLYFINSEGEVVHKVVGALKADQLISAGGRALALSEPADDYAAAYAEGDRDPELVYKYVRALIRNGESHLRVANDYLRSQDDLSTEQNLQFIVLSATEADSRIFTIMTEHRAQIETLLSEDAFLSQVYMASQSTAEKAIEYSSHELLEEAWAAMEAHYPEKAEAFKLQTEMSYTAAHYDGRAFTRAARDYARTVLSDDADGLQSLAMQLVEKFPSESRALALAENIARDATSVGEGYQYYYTLASILHLRGKLQEALEAAEEAKELAEAESTAAVRMVDVLILKIQEG